MLDQIKLQDLCLPFKEPSKEGADLTFDPAFDEIKKQRRLAQDEDLPQGVWTDQPQKRYHRVAALCAQLLTERTKDLTLGLWMAEAWLCTDGLYGLLRGLDLCQLLLKNFGASLYPHVQNEDDQERVQLLCEAMDNALYDRLFTLRVADPQDAGKAPYSYGQYLDIERHTALSKKKKDAQRYLQLENLDTLEQARASVKSTPASFYATEETHAKRAIDALNRLEKSLKQYGKVTDQSCFSNTRGGIEGLLGHISSFKEMAHKPTPAKALKEKLQVFKGLVGGEPTKKASTPPSPEPTPEASDKTANTVDAFHEKLKNGTLSKPEAYDALEKIACRLQTLDPQSPVPGLLHKIRAWENKTYGDIIKDFNSPAEAIQFLGLVSEKKQAQ